MARFVAVEVPPSQTHTLLDVEVPDSIYMAYHGVKGQQWLHEDRAVSFDKGHDWSVRGGKVRMPPSQTPSHFVFVYGTPACGSCDKHLAIGARFCPWCGTETESEVV